VKNNGGEIGFPGARGVSGWRLFLKELVRAPRDTGALCPSSQALARRMAEAISPSIIKSGYLVELGAGTGSVTEALLSGGVPPGKLVVVEKSEPLALCLRERFPQANVLCCGAEEIGSRTGGPVRAIVSSLPFRSLPRDICEAIMTEVEDVLAPGGLFVQFTYALIGEMPFVPKSFRKLRSSVVIRNIPPAKVEVFRKPKSGSAVGSS
jgi:phospholipid N-methyltransferase